MTKLLEKAINEMTKLPTRDQNRIARKLLAEVEGGMKRQSAEKVPPLLAKMVAKVKRDHKAGRTVEMGWDEL
ncbi:MAG TPA: hypothetical protein VF595_16240 [Tepidisphaeraceae bacterium]|jgi:hypothetical protein